MNILLVQVTQNYKDQSGHRSDYNLLTDCIGYSNVHACM